MQPRSEVPPKGSLSDQISFDDVAELLHVAMERYQETRKPVLVSVTRPLLMDVSPIELFHAAQKLVGSRYYWAKPAQKSWMVSAGDAVQIVTEGPLRFQEASARIRETVSSAVIQPDGGSGPIFMGGFRFSSLMSNEGPWEVFHDGLLTLPKWMILASANGLRRIVTNVVVDAATQVDTLRNELHTEAVALFGSASDSWQSVRLGPIKVESDGGDWGRNVVEALDAIEDGTLTKVTLARTLRLSSQTPIQPEPVLSNLQANYPECHVFAFCRDGLCFVGASPEELVRLQDSTVTSTCLAGSTARGESETEDSELSDRMLSSVKERREHAVVVDWVLERMGRLCDKIKWDEIPKVVRLGNLQHLGTRFEGEPKKGCHVLRFVEALHPTPAVGGMPLRPALEMIERLENFDRGWYTGPVGWVDGYGDGEFAIAIRCALLRGNEAILYAGAGIVSGADPDREDEETKMKFKPLLNALGASL